MPELTGRAAGLVLVQRDDPELLLAAGRGESYLKALLREILRHADQASPPPESLEEGGREQRVLTLYLDGVRYTIVRAQPESAEPQIVLSPREQEIVRLVAEGLSNKTIALLLDISAWTVATHLRRVFAKLEVGSRAEMVARVLKDGLLSEADPRGDES